MLQKWIVDSILSSGQVTALVGTNVTPDVYAGDTYPVVIYTVSSIEPINTMASAANFFSADVTVECWSDSYAEAIDLASKVNTTLEYKTGDNGPVTVSATTLESWSSSTDQLIGSGNNYNESSIIYGQILTYTMWYNTTV